MGESNTKQSGVVKWFQKAKGYGFITVNGADIFCHWTSIEAEGYKTLQEGQAVTCKIAIDTRCNKFKAVEVEVIK